LVYTLIINRKYQSAIQQAWNILHIRVFYIKYQSILQTFNRAAVTYTRCDQFLFFEYL